MDRLKSVVIVVMGVAGHTASGGAVAFRFLCSNTIFFDFCELSLAQLD